MGWYWNAEEEWQHRRQYYYHDADWAGSEHSSVPEVTPERVQPPSSCTKQDEVQLPPRPWPARAEQTRARPMQSSWPEPQMLPTCPGSDVQRQERQVQGPTFVMPPSGVQEAAVVMPCAEPSPPRDPNLPEWVEVRDGWNYCTLCRLYATDGHLSSEKHKYRQDMYEWERSDENSSRPAEGPPEAWGDPSYFEWRDGWHWFCKLCNQWSDLGHVQGKRHQKKVQWETWTDEDNVWANTKWAGPCDYLDDDLDTRTPSTATHATQPPMDPWGPHWEAGSVSSRTGPTGSTGREKAAAEEEEDTSAIQWC